MIAKFTMNNVGQCWSCKNCIGSKKVRRVKAIVDFRPALYGKVYSNVEVILPECKVMNLYMTHVYHNPCDSYISIIDS